MAVRLILGVLAFGFLVVSLAPPASAHSGCTTGLSFGQSLSAVTVGTHEVECGAGTTGPHFHSHYRQTWVSAPLTGAGVTVSYLEYSNGTHYESWTATGGASVAGFGAGGTVQWGETGTTTCRQWAIVGVGVARPGQTISDSRSTGLIDTCNAWLSPTDLPV